MDTDPGMSRRSQRSGGGSALSRRAVLLRGGAVVAMGAAVASGAAPGPFGNGALGRIAMAAGAPPFPTLNGGRLIGHDLDRFAAEMMSGGPGKDGIPAIDDPVYADAEWGDGYLDDGDIVFGLVQGDTVRAYPQRILVWHEIVNDDVEGVGLAVTYCPLTGTAIAFERADTEFGVSGRLVNSNLIMYDRDTDTWFPQVLAAGIQGPHRGSALVERPLVWTTWSRWRDAYPGTEVLTTETGFARNYNRDPYGRYNPREGYYEPDSRPMFAVLNDDDRFAAKQVVIGARNTEHALAFHKQTLREAGRLHLDVDGAAYTAIHDTVLDSGYIFEGRIEADFTIDGFGPEGVRFADGTRPRALNAFDAMWFAWAAFYPQTTVEA